jgi:protein-L-isoaspartate O-methyltransferase
VSFAEPYVGTPEDAIPAMLSLAEVKADEKVIDLGSGDGRIVIAAARDFHAVALGVEARERLVRESRRRIRELGLSGRARIIHGDWENLSLKEADVLATFISSVTLEALKPKLERELRPGTRLVNFSFPVLGWEVAKKVQVVPRRWRVPRTVYLHVVPDPSVQRPLYDAQEPLGAALLPEGPQDGGARLR